MQHNSIYTQILPHLNYDFQKMTLPVYDRLNCELFILVRPATNNLIKRHHFRSRVKIVFQLPTTCCKKQLKYILEEQATDKT